MLILREGWPKEACKDLCSGLELSDETYESKQQGICTQAARSTKQQQQQQQQQLKQLKQFKQLKQLKQLKQQLKQQQQQLKQQQQQAPLTCHMVPWVRRRSALSSNSVKSSMLRSSVAAVGLALTTTNNSTTPR